MAKAHGLSVKSIDDNELDVLSSNDVLVATKNAKNDIIKLMRKR